MKDRLVTIALSVAATLGLQQADKDSPRVLEVDRLIVRHELIVSDTGDGVRAERGAGLALTAHYQASLCRRSSPD